MGPWLLDRFQLSVRINARGLVAQSQASESIAVGQTNLDYDQQTP